MSLPAATRPDGSPRRRCGYAASAASARPNSQPGRASLHQLVQGADAVVASYRPGAAAAQGADYATLAALNPGLVYCSVTGWGPRGPYSDYPDDEALVAAKSGRMWSFANIVRRDGPGFPAVRVGTHAAAQSAVAGILAACHACERTGRGQIVETSLLQGMFPYDLGSLVREQMALRYPELFRQRPAGPLQLTQRNGNAWLSTDPGR